MKGAFRSLVSWFRGEDPNLRSRQVRRQAEREEAKKEEAKIKAQNEAEARAIHEKKLKNKGYFWRSRWRYIAVAQRKTRSKIALNEKQRANRLAWKRWWKGITHANW
jgi:hypothetical protein